MRVWTEIVPDSAPGWRSLAWVLCVSRVRLVVRLELWRGMLQLGGRVMVDFALRRCSLRLFLAFLELSLAIAEEEELNDEDDAA